MAQLTTSDYRELRDSVYRLGAGKEELKALANLPNKTQILAAFQGLEDATVAHFTSTVKPAIDAALGVTTSTALARKIYAGYLLWKISHV
jgi:hypothetical protein